VRLLLAVYDVRLEHESPLPSWASSSTMRSGRHAPLREQTVASFVKCRGMGKPLRPDDMVYRSAKRACDSGPVFGPRQEASC